MLARLFVTVGGLLVFLLLLALVGPHFINWTSYRADFEREASAVLGRSVKVNGEATARILPFPSVTFSNVTVGAVGGREPAMTVETFSMDAELAPLLHGDFLIFDMRLGRPKVLIDVASDGTVDWAVRPSAPFDADRISLENLTISDGEVVIRHRASGREHVVSGIDANLAARSLSGPWRGAGTMTLDGRRASVSASTGTASGDAIRLKLDIVPDASSARLALEGNVKVSEGALSYAGAFHLSQIPPAEKAGEQKADPGYRLSGKFDLDQARAVVTDARFETGPRDDPYAAEGSASIEFGATPRFALEANGEQVLLDEEQAEANPAGIPLGERIAALEAVIRSVPRPQIPGTVTVNLPAVVAGDTTVRDLRLAASPAEGGWNVESFQATLPGRATLEAEGLVRTSEDFGFEGSMLLAVAQPSGFAAWLGQDIEEAIRRLPAAGLNAKVKLSSARQSFEDLELILGDARLHGAIDSILPPAGAAIRPSLRIRLDGGHVDTDQLRVFSSLFLGRDGFNQLAGRDVDFALNAGPVTAGDVEAKGIDTSFTLRDGQLDVEKLALKGLAGADIAATGRLNDLDADPSGSATVTVEGGDLKPLVDVAASWLPGSAALRDFQRRVAAYPALVSDSRVTFDAAATNDASGDRTISLSAKGSAGGSALSGTMSASGSPQAPSDMRIDASLSFEHPDGAQFLALIGLPAEPLGLTGPAKLSVAASGTPSKGLQSSIALEGRQFAARFDGKISSGPSGIGAVGPATLRADDVEPWMLTMGAVLPGFGLGTPVDLRGEMDYADGLLVLTDIEGSIDEGAVTGAVNVAMRGDRPEITGDLSLDSFDFSRVAAAVLGGSAFDENAEGRAETPFRELPIPAFTAALNISAGAADASSLGPLYDASFALYLDAERVNVSGLTASYHDGKLAGDFEIKNNAGTGLLTAQMDLRGAQFANAFEGGGLQGQGDLSASVSASGKTIDGMISSLGGAGSAALSNVHVAGLAGGAFPRLLAEADWMGGKVDGGKISAIAKQVAARGSFAIPRVDIAFTVAGGQLRAPPVTVANGDGTLDLDIQADLRTGSVNAKGLLTYSAGTDVLVGSEPSVGLSFTGPFETTAIRFDSAPLVQFLTQRALEREQARVEAMQEELLEKQRLRRENRYYASLAVLRQQADAEAERRDEAARSRVEDRVVVEAEERRRAAMKADDEARAAQAIRLVEGDRRAANRQTPAPEPTPTLPDNDAEILRALGLPPPVSPSQ